MLTAKQLRFLNRELDYKSKKKSKAISVIGRGGIKGCQMSRIPHRLDNRFICGG
jgi:hypothetical protein